MNKAYKKILTKEIPTLGVKAVMYEHIQTGAQIVHLENDDTHKCFMIGFQTIPLDSTGVAHILEHSVLAGSKKYPLKDPFALLIKSSLKTFLNAFTWPDRTVYPVASKNDQDLKNLMDVYLNAVFEPLLTENTFKQEGWHYELDKNNNLIYKGVVFNEMKGSNSDVGNATYRKLAKALLPDTNYANNSGGDSKDIPHLTLKKLKAFHKKHYHPSKAKIYFYGKLDINDYLDHIEPYLAKYKKQPAHNEAQIQRYFTEPKVIKDTIPSSPEKKEKGGVVVLGWLLGDKENRTGTLKEQVSWGIMDSLLIGSNASQFKKVILESKLGESIAGFGYDDSNYQPSFSMGLKNVKVKDFKAVEKLFLSELEKFVANGIDKKLIESIITKVEFDFKEMEPGDDYPKPVELGTELMGPWTHDFNPLDNLDIESVIKDLKNCITDNSHYFEDLIKKSLINNPHRVTLELATDPDLQQKALEKENKKLATQLKALNDDERKKLKKETVEFHKYQKEEDSQEAIATLPKLEVNDLAKKNETWPVSIQSSLFTIVSNPIQTHDIIYLDYQFDISHLAFEEKQLITLVRRYLLRLPTKRHTAEDLRLEIDLACGSLHTGYMLKPSFEGDKDILTCSIYAKFLAEKTEKALDLIQEICTELTFTDIEKIGRVLSEEKAKREAEVISDGNTFALNYSRAAIDPLYAQAQYFSGIKYIQNLKTWEKEFETNKVQFIKDIENVYKKVFTNKNLVIHVTTDNMLMASTLEKAISTAEHFTSSPIIKNIEVSIPQINKSTAFIITAPVSYQGMSLPLVFTDQITRGSLRVIRKLMYVDYLWKKVRQLGGAYGSNASFDIFAKILSFSSYRDPNIAKTYEAFNNIGNYLIEISQTISQKDINDCIISAIGDMDYPLNAKEKGDDSLDRYLTDFSDEKRQTLRDEILSTTSENIKALGEYLLTVKPEQIAIATLSGKELLERKENKDLFEVTETL